MSATVSQLLNFTKVNLNKSDVIISIIYSNYAQLLKGKYLI